MADLVGKVTAIARAAIDRLFQRASIRFGLGRTDAGHKTLFVSVNEKHTIPGMYISAAREFGVHPRPRVLDQIRKVAGGYLDAQRNAGKAAVTRVVENILRNAPEGKIGAATVKQLDESIGSVMTKLTSAMERIASTEAIAARNLGSLEAITAMGMTAGVQDPVVYFVIVRDGQACKECVRLHMFGPTEPRLWRRSEVVSGYHLPGDNYPSLFGEHPNCFTAETRLATDRGLFTIKELFDQGESLQVVVDSRVKNFRVGNNQYGAEIPGKTRLHRHASGSRMMSATAVYDTGERPCVRITLETGAVLEVSEEHEMWVDDDASGKKVQAVTLQIGDKIPLLSGEGGWGTDRFVEIAELIGNLMGDGWLDEHSGRASWRFFGDDIPYGETLLEKARPFAGANNADVLTIRPANEKYQVVQAGFTRDILGRMLIRDFALSKKPRRVPQRLWGADRATVAAFLRGLYAADGHSESTPSVVLAQNDKVFLQEIQLLLSNFGLRARIFAHGQEISKDITYADGSVHQTNRRPCWRMMLGGWDQVEKFSQVIGMGVPRKQAELLARLDAKKDKGRLGAWRTAKVASVEKIGVRHTYCLTEPMTNTVTANGMVVGQCRCQLTIMLPGWDFNEAGFAHYVAPGHDAIARQRGGK